MRNDRHQAAIRSAGEARSCWDERARGDARGVTKFDEVTGAYATAKSTPGTDPKNAEVAPDVVTGAR